MWIKNRTAYWWKQWPVIGFVGLTLWIFFQFDPVFEQNTTALLWLLPLAWASLNINFPAFQSDPGVYTPKNIMLFIWLNKLLIIPIELIFIGNKVASFDLKNQPLVTEISIVLLSCVAFGVGWGSNLLKIPKYKIPPFRTAGQLAIVYIIIALSSLILLYGSLSNYWAGAIFTYATREALEQVSGTFVGFLANVGQRFWAFGVILFWYLWDRRYKPLSQRYWQIPWLFLCVIGTLSSNRTNMIFPFLTFLSILWPKWEVGRKWWLITLVFSLIFLVLFFGHVRVQPFLDPERIHELFTIYWSDTNYIWSAHQLYFGTPYQISPLLTDTNPTFTLLASVLEPIPILGKAFREQSGPFVYNSALNKYFSQDQIIPMAGELFYNGGYLLVTAGYMAFGMVYRWLDATFKNYIITNLPLAACFFYLSLLFNATLLLSLSVLVQFALYNAPPALLFIAINWWRMRKAS
jgi:hypothetical protein